MENIIYELGIVVNTCIINILSQELRHSVCLRQLISVIRAVGNRMNLGLLLDCRIRNHNYLSNSKCLRINANRNSY